MLNSSSPSDIITCYVNSQSLEDVSYRMGVGITHLYNMMHYEFEMTEEVSEKLSECFKTSVEFWINIDKQYTEFNKNQKIKGE